MGADIGALVALDALGSVPGGDGHGHAALLIGGGAQLELAVHMIGKGGDGQLSPSILPTGSRISLTIFTSSGLPSSFLCSGSSTALAQSAGTSTFL